MAFSLSLLFRSLFLETPLSWLPMGFPSAPLFRPMFLETPGLGSVGGSLCLPSFGHCSWIPFVLVLPGVHWLSSFAYCRTPWSSFPACPSFDVLLGHCSTAPLVFGPQVFPLLLDSLAVVPWMVFPLPILFRSLFLDTRVLNAYGFPFSSLFRSLFPRPLLWVPYGVSVTAHLCLCSLWVSLVLLYWSLLPNPFV